MKVAAIRDVYHSASGPHQRRNHEEDRQPAQPDADATVAWLARQLPYADADSAARPSPDRLPGRDRAMA
jgi:hypothetical protein